MRILHEIFVEQVMETEGLDASNYRPTRLKTRLQRNYPQLVFHRPATRNQSKLVFVEELSVGEVTETSGTADTEGASLADSDSDEEMITDTPADKKDVILKEYYDVAMALQNAIKGRQVMDSSWPPLSVDLPTTQVLKMVPIVLFNCIAWILGFSDYPEMSLHLKLEDPHKTKVCLPRRIVHSIKRVKTNTKVSGTAYGCKTDYTVITTRANFEWFWPLH